MGDYYGKIFHFIGVLLGLRRNKKKKETQRKKE